MRVGIRFLLLICLAFLASSTSSKCEDRAGLDYFEKNVRPLLVRQCYECHSEKSGKRKGGLWLDRRSGWVTGGDSGTAVVAGRPGESLLVSAVRYESLEMPPKGKLSESQIHIIEKWVTMGAPAPDDSLTVPADKSINLQTARRFWAFQSPKRHTPPEPEALDWPRSVIDQFVLASLEETGLTPARDADPRAWLRRVTFDLTGLPPTINEQREFLESYGNHAESARAAVVDQLLESPHFGEQWGRHWLDLARYADSNGGDINLTYFNAWRYRDYVVRAFNSDKPYDEFVREQIAGDLMTSGDDAVGERLIATGFLLVGPKMLSERNKEKLYMDVVDEQLDSLGRVFLGLTPGCARCHDHKFDPISVRDYYALAGILRSTETIYGIRMNNVNVSGWLEQPLPMSEEQAAAVRDHEKQLSEIDTELKPARKRLAGLQKSTTPKPEDLPGIVVDDVDATLVGFWKKSSITKRFVGEGYIHDDKKDVGKKSVTYTPEIPAAGEYEVRISFASGNGRSSRVPVVVHSADGEREVIVNQVKTPEQNSLFHTLGRFRFEAGKSGWVRVSNRDADGHVIADSAQFLSVNELKNPGSMPEADRRDAEIQALSDKVKQLESRRKKLVNSAPEKPMAMAARDHEKVGDSEIRIRGIADHRGETVRRAFLPVLNFDGSTAVNPEQSGRLELADWVSHRNNPLTARVLVNRVWMHLMGEGLVRTVDNFGKLGDRPSHPELLDSLAVDFMDQNWSIKKVVRRICLSRTYGMATEYRGDAFTVDPENRRLWRQHRRRLPAESIRDAMLAVSGRLNPTIGGSSVAHMGEQAVQNSSGDKKEQNRSSGLRRSLYEPIVRNDLPPFLTVFDFADPDVVTGRRPVTNVPAQGLLMLNSPFVRDCARATAEQLQSEVKSSDDQERLAWLYRRLLGRLPSEPERDRDLEFIQSINADDEAFSVSAWSRLSHTIFASSEFQMLN